MTVDYKDIESLIRLFERSDWDELRVETGDIQLVLSSDPAAKPLGQTNQAAQTGPTAPVATAPAVSAVAAASAASAQADTGDIEGMIVIRAPNLGTFYRAPNPGSPPYVEVGQVVNEDTEVCLIEVMKLFTPAKSGVGGRIARVCVGDGEMVEHDQPLFYVDPTANAAEAAE